MIIGQDIGSAEPRGQISAGEKVDAGKEPEFEIAVRCARSLVGSSLYVIDVRRAACDAVQHV